MPFVVGAISLVMFSPVFAIGLPFAPVLVFAATILRLQSQRQQLIQS